jgi:hypothetical protein
MDTIENRTFDEIKIGDTASLVRTLSKRYRTGASLANGTGHA